MDKESLARTNATNALDAMLESIWRQEDTNPFLERLEGALGAWRAHLGRIRHLSTMESGTVEGLDARGRGLYALLLYAARIRMDTAVPQAEARLISRERSRRIQREFPRQPIPANPQATIYV